jgi:hypothetical protein
MEPVSREVDNCAVGKHDGDEDEYNGDNSHGILSDIDKVRAFVFIVLSTNVTFYSGYRSARAVVRDTGSADGLFLEASRDSGGSHWRAHTLL